MPALAAMRFAAAVAVIWTHSAVNLPSSLNKHPGDLLRFGSAFFTQCTIFLCLIKSFRTPDASLGRYAVSRFRRVYLPFLGWTVIYVGLKLLLMLGGRKEHDIDISPALLWNGGEFHLWFLPFALVAGIVVFAVGGMIPPRVRIAAAIAFAAIGAAAAPFPMTTLKGEFQLNYLLVMSWNRVPSVMWGAAIGCLWQSSAASILKSRLAGALGGLMLVSCIVALFLHGPNNVVENLAGLGGMLLTLAAGGRGPAGLMMLGRLTFGVYLCHMLFVGFCRTLLGHFGIDDETLEFAMLTTFVVTTSSVAFTMLMIKTRFTRWLAPV